MVTDTLTPPRQPSAGGTTHTAKVRVITTAYGDGFKTTAPDGVNAVERSQTLIFDPILVSEADAIVTFLIAHAGVPFWYTLPRDIAPRCWVCTGWERSYPNPVTDALTIQLEERLVY